MAKTDTPTPSSARRDRPLYLIGRLIGLSVFLGALLIGGYTVDRAAYEAGYQGVHGTLTIKECTSRLERSGTSHRRHRHHSTTRRVACTGSFRSDDGTTTVAAASVDTEGVMFEPGKQLSVQQTSGDYVLTGWGRARLSLAIGFGCVAAVAWGVFSLLTGFGGRRGPRFGEAWRAVPGGLVLRPVLAGIGALGVAGAAVLLLMDLIAD